MLMPAAAASVACAVTGVALHLVGLALDMLGVAFVVLGLSLHVASKPFAVDAMALAAVLEQAHHLRSNLLFRRRSESL
jgi:hypothetical protein